MQNNVKGVKRIQGESNKMNRINEMDNKTEQTND